MSAATIDFPIRVIDVETTGFTPGEDRIVEVGWVDLWFDRRADEWRFDPFASGSSLVNPGREIPPEAKAVHHITEAMVEDAPTWEEISVRVLDPVFHFAAHNAEFDTGFCGCEGWLCTMRLAMHVYPDAPGFGNQVLRYWRGFERLDRSVLYINGSAEVHRAGFDALCTATVLRDMLNGPLRERSRTEAFGELVAFAAGPVVLRGKLGFGKYADLTWAEVAAKDIGYFDWMVSKSSGDWSADRLHTAKHYLGRLL